MESAYASEENRNGASFGKSQLLNFGNYTLSKRIPIFDIGEFFDIREIFVFEIFCQKGEFKELDRIRKSLFFD